MLWSTERTGRMAREASPRSLPGLRAATRHFPFRLLIPEAALRRRAGSCGLCPLPPWRTAARARRCRRSRIQVWLYEQVNMRIEGCIIGFDEYMNLVLDDAEEIHSKTKSRKQLGRIMLKGDNITLLQSVSN
uniref:Small nuclear ribonucleoprotein E n=1 Tax=Equus asinus TaxID=9793 RepID=A0A9L0J6D9_EQUAS